MKRQLWKKRIAVFLALVLSIHAPFVMPASLSRVYGYTARQATINASSLNVRSGPGTSYSRVTNLSKGASVTVINETTGSDGKLWYQIRLSNGSTGYVLGTYIRFPVTYNQDSNFEAFLSSQGFPESYKPGLRQLHAQYPNWVFEAQQTGLDWNTVIQNESIIPRSLIHKNSISSHKSMADGAYNWDTGTWTGFDGSSWVAASEDIIRYYMDPRNFLDDVYVFQFMNHKYDASVQTREGLQNLVKGTFLEDNTTGGGTWSNTGNNTSVQPGNGNSNYGPGGSGVVVSPGTSSTGSGPGVSGGSPNGTNASPGASGSQEVKLQGPSASISRHDAPKVAATVRVGVKPGEGGSAGGTSPSPGGNGSGGTSPSPVVTPGGNFSGGTSSSPTVTPGGNPSGRTSSSPVVTPGGNTSGGTSSSPTVTPGGTSSSPDHSSSGQNSSGAGGTVSYVDVIMKAAEVSGVNPYVLTAMIIQEQGSNGKGNSISGTNASYPGYYNYFNVGAYAADGMGAVERGLWYASQSGSYGRPWNTPEKSIIGGAQFYGENYVRGGQDTFYLKKYNVQGSNLYKHQYMTNVDGAASEASIFAESFSDRIKSMPLRFRIPVYNNMPQEPCPKPTGDGSPNNKLSSLGVDGFALTPTFNRDIYSYNLIVNDSVSVISVHASAIDSKAAVSGTGSFQLSSGNNEIRVRVKAQNGTEREYVLHIVRQGGGAVPGGNTSYSPGGSGQSPVISGPGTSGSPGGQTNAAPTSGGQTNTAPTPGGSNVIVINP